MMNKRITKGLAIVLPDKKVNLFVLFVIFLGIISGSIFLVVLKEGDINMVVERITSFMNNINTNNINNGLAFKNAFIGNIIYIVVLWILGMSIVGVIINVFLIYVKGFIIGFSISSFILVYKYKGLVAGIIYAFPTSIINIFICLLLGTYSILMTIGLWKMIFSKDRNYSMRRLIKRYAFVLVICIVLATISSLLEGFLVPSFLKLVIKLFI